MLVQHSSQKDWLGKSVYIYICRSVQDWVASKATIQSGRAISIWVTISMRQFATRLQRGNYNEIDGKVSTNNVTSLRVCPITWSSEPIVMGDENFVDVIYKRNSEFYIFSHRDKIFLKKETKISPINLHFYHNFPYILQYTPNSI